LLWHHAVNPRHKRPGVHAEENQEPEPEESEYLLVVEVDRQYALY